MSRITRIELDALAANVSERLLGSLSVQVHRRNGATALDLYDAAGRIRLLAIGSARTVETYLRGMEATLEVIGR